MKTVLKAIIAIVAVVLGVLAGLAAVLARSIGKALPIIIVVLVCFWLFGCTTNVTIDNSVIDQSDVTQVLGCATDSVYADL